MTSTELDDFTTQNGAFGGKTSLKDRARQARDRAADVFQTRVEPLADSAVQYADKARLGLMNAGRMGAQKAKEHPGISALVILGVGLLAGAVLATTLRQPASRFGGQLGGSIKSAGRKISSRLGH